MKTNRFGSMLNGVKKRITQGKEFLAKRKLSRISNLNSKVESSKMNSLIFFGKKDIINTLSSKGYEATIPDTYHVLYAISSKIIHYNVINIDKFLRSGNILFIPSTFRDNIELIDSSGEIVLSFTPNVGNQEVLLTSNSNIIGIRRSKKFEEEGL